jgi:hypothetical protein
MSADRRRDPRHPRRLLKKKNTAGPSRDMGVSVEVTSYPRLVETNG